MAVSDPVSVVKITQALIRQLVVFALELGDVGKDRYGPSELTPARNIGPVC